MDPLVLGTAWSWGSPGLGDPSVMGTPRFLRPPVSETPGLGYLPVLRTPGLRDAPSLGDGLVSGYPHLATSGQITPNLGAPNLGTPNLGTSGLGTPSLGHASVGILCLSIPGLGSPGLGTLVWVPLSGYPHAGLSPRQDPPASAASNLCLSLMQLPKSSSFVFLLPNT